MCSADCTDDLYIFKMKLDLGVKRANRVDSGWANVMVQWIRVLAAKPDNLSSSPGIYMVEEEIELTPKRCPQTFTRAP